MIELGKAGSANWAAFPICVIRSARTFFVRTESIPENNDLDESTIDWSIFRAEDISPVTIFVLPGVALSPAPSATIRRWPAPYVVSTRRHVESQLKYLHSMALPIWFSSMILSYSPWKIPRDIADDDPHRFNFRWVSFFRCSNTDDEVIALMKESGCFLGCCWASSRGTSGC